MRKGIILLIALSLLISMMSVSAQGNLDGVKLFQNYLYDAPITKNINGEGGLQYNSYDGYSITNIGVQGGYPVNEKLEIDAAIDYTSLSPEKGDGKSGLTDIPVVGRYNLSNKKGTNISAGGMITLPVGTEDVGGGNLNFGGFSAIRRALDNGMIITGTIGLIFYETINEKGEDDRDNKLNIGAGLLYPIDKKLCIVGELGIQSQTDYMMLSGGVDYMLANGRLRAALGLGLDDGAPDMSLIVKYAKAFK